MQPYKAVQASSGVMMWRIFSWHTLKPWISHSSNATAHLSIVVDHVYSFMCIQLLMATSRRIKRHVTKLISLQTGFFNMTSKVTRSQPNKANLGCYAMADLYHGYAATVWSSHTNVEQNLWGSLLNLCNEALQQIWATLSTEMLMTISPMCRSWMFTTLETSTKTSQWCWRNSDKSQHHHLWGPLKSCLKKKFQATRLTVHKTFFVMTFFSNVTFSHFTHS